MNTKTMEGLIGAGANMDLVNTPMRVYKEARRKGDTATMERAMGYADELAGYADEYRLKAHDGTREEAKESREEEERKRNEAIEKRREERKKLAERIDEVRADRETPEGTIGESKNPVDEIIDTVEISEAGKTALENMMEAGSADVSAVIGEDDNSV